MKAQNTMLAQEIAQAFGWSTSLPLNQLLPRVRLMLIDLWAEREGIDVAKIHLLDPAAVHVFGYGKDSVACYSNTRTLAGLSERFQLEMLGQNPLVVADNYRRTLCLTYSVRDSLSWRDIGRLHRVMKNSGRG